MIARQVANQYGMALLQASAAQGIMEAVLHEYRPGISSVGSNTANPLFFDVARD